MYDLETALAYLGDRRPWAGPDAFLSGTDGIGGYFHADGSFSKLVNFIDDCMCINRNINVNGANLDQIDDSTDPNRLRVRMQSAK